MCHNKKKKKKPFAKPTNKNSTKQNVSINRKELKIQFGGVGSTNHGSDVSSVKRKKKTP